jgi:hypothetical protein
MRHRFCHQQANSQATLPLNLFSAMTVHDNKFMPVSNGLDSQKEQKVLQAYTVNIYTRKEGTAVPQKGI